MTIQTYRLPLPSGGCVHVRQPPLYVKLSRGQVGLSLLHAAASVTATEDAQPPRDPLDSIRNAAASALLQPSLARELPWSDLMAVATWALSDQIAPALPDASIPFRSSELEPLVRGGGAILLDAVAHRYGCRPSTLLDIPAMAAAEFDLAIGFRGLLRENAGNDGEVETEDYFGNIHKVPRSVLPADEPGKKVNLDWYAEHYHEIGGGEPIGLSPGAGGMEIMARRRSVH